LSLEEDELAADDSTETVDLDITASTSRALLLNNNRVGFWDEFSETLRRLFVDHTSHLCWLDLALNELRTIDPCILELKNLTMLYLHCNNIGRIADVDKLSRLGRLKSLTLHGNPIESNAGYRQYIICHLPQLLTFDFSGITKSDRATADTWITMIAPPPTKGKRKTETAE
jgi:Leucine-rich repeat (LRR) protein